MAENKNIVIRLMADTASYEASMTRAGSTARSVASGMENTGRKSALIASGMTAAGLAVAAFGVAAVKMAGKYAVNVPLLQPVIFQPGNRKMAEQDFVTVGVLKIPQELTLSWIRFASFQIFIRETVTVNAADTEGLAVDGDILSLIHISEPTRH